MLHAVESAVASIAVPVAVDNVLEYGSRFSEWSSSTWFRKQVANCNLNRSKSQARVELENIHGRGNMLFFEVRIGK